MMFAEHSAKPRGWLSVAVAVAVTAAVVGLGDAHAPHAARADNGRAPGSLQIRSSGFPHIVAQAPAKTADAEVSVGSIPLTLVPGWRVVQREEQYLAALNSRKDAAFTVWEAEFESGTSIEEATGRFYRAVTEEMTNASHTSGYDPGFVGERFNESTSLGYNGDLLTDKGTLHVVGVLAVLLNSDTGHAALVKMASTDAETLMDNVDDANAMTESMLG